MKKIKSVLLNTSQPEDLAKAVRAEADRTGMTISAYVGSVLAAGLPSAIREKLAARPAVGAPHKKKPKLVK